MSTEDAVRVIYIAGAGRSGSTVISRLLGEVQGFTNVGEAARYLFNTRMSSRRLPCGCGKQIEECEFWRDIVSSIPERARDLATEHLRIRHFWRLLLPVKPRGLRETVDEIAAATGGVFEALAGRDECGVIVDSSKNPANAYLLSRIPGVELYVVHLVRDPRSVVASWHEPKAYLRGFSPLRVTVWWWVYNFTSEMLRRYAKGYLRVRYEDFARDPGSSLSSVGRLVTEDDLDLAFLRGNVAYVDTQHILAGNPDRNRRGEMTISERQRYLKRSLRLLVTLLTLPLLRRYRYPLRRSDETS